MKRYLRIFTLVLSLILLTGSMVSCKARDQRVVGSCGGYEILYQEIRYEAKNYLNEHPDASEEEVRGAVERAIVERYAMLALCTERIPGLTLDSEELDERADAEIEAGIEEMGGKSSYRKLLKENDISKHFFKYLIKVTLMQTELENALYKDTHLENDQALINWWKAGNTVRVTRLVFSDRAKAEAVHASLQAGTPLTDLVGTDILSGVKIDSNYSYFRDLNGGADEQAALALAQPGDRSDVVESADGFCLLIREEDNFDNLLYLTTTGLEKYREAQLTALIDEKADTLTPQWNERGAALDLRDLK